MQRKIITEIQKRIQKAQKQHTGTTQPVLLIGASKAQSLDTMIAALKNGLTAVGENYAQELLQKRDALLLEQPDLAASVEWHFIGKIQRRKIRHLVSQVDCFHTVDRQEVAQEIHQRALAKGLSVRALVQVNVGQEASKGGVDPNELSALIRFCNDLGGIRLIGLMCLPPFQDDPERMRPYFQQVRELRDAINHESLYKEPLSHLSMGMSHDFEVAIQEGATMVRIGAALFGERDGIKR